MPTELDDSLKLIAVPFAFTQDDLLTTKNFIRKAKERGYNLSVETLQNLHASGILRPLFRISDTPSEDRRLKIGNTTFGNEPRGWAILAASEGRLIDPRHEMYSDGAPHQSPNGEDDPRWWNGYLYSSWQLIFLTEALQRYRNIQVIGISPETVNMVERQTYKAVCGLVALAPRYLPAAIGRAAIPTGISEQELWSFRVNCPSRELLSMVQFDAIDLKGYAETLLIRAHARDPLAKWLKLLRHMSFSGWSRLQGMPLDCMWMRVAAELFLSCHDDLAEEGLLEPLPDLTGEAWYTPLHDRLTPQHDDAETLERALGDFGLSPYPRVLVLVEGETEKIHVSKLLAEVGLTKPSQVRVQVCRGSKVNTQLLVRYGIAPRVGRQIGDVWLLETTPTALVVVMDPENMWSTPEKCEKQRATLLSAIREEVNDQGADIDQDYLEFLVTVRTWGENSYELANFTDEEILSAIELLKGAPYGSDRQVWHSNFLAILSDTRSHRQDVKVALGRARIAVSKPDLAEALWPTLREKFIREMSSDTQKTPVVSLIADIRRIYARIHGIRAMKVPDNQEALSNIRDKE